MPGRSRGWDFSGLKVTLLRGVQWVNRLGAIPLLRSIPALRGASGAAVSRIRVPRGIHWDAVRADGVRCEWLTPPDALGDAALLYLHGGGGVLGLYNSCRNLAGHIALSCSLRVLLADYRLAPEHPFPAGLNDSLTAYRWLLSERVPPERIVLAGDSMGGLIAICTLVALRDSGQPLPAAAVCISPNTDLTFSGKTMQTNAGRDALLSPEFARTLGRLYAGWHDLSDPHLSPLSADLHGLPPMLVQAGAYEILLDDSRRFADCASAVGVDLTLEVWPKMWHDWHLCVPNLPEANQAIEHIGEFVRARLGH